MIKQLITILLATFTLSAQASDCVIFLHGMSRTEISMNKLEREIAKDGYITWNKTYTTIKKPIEDVAKKHIESGIEYCESQDTESIHLLTHSLGGILVRVYLQDKEINKLGNIVMLSPPNSGSELTDLFKEWKIYQWVAGPAGQALGTDPNSYVNSLKPVEANIGVITGKKSNDPWFSPIIPGDDDGKVSVESAKLKEMKDFLIVEATHTFIMRDMSTINQIKNFLKEGKFNRG